MGRIEENELLDLPQLLEQLFHGEPRPGRLSLFVDVLQEGDTQQAIESVNADLAVGPVIHRTPPQPVPIFEAAEDLLDLLLARECSHDLFSGPIRTIRQ